MQQLSETRLSIKERARNHWLGMFARNEKANHLRFVLEPPHFKTPHVDAMHAAAIYNTFTVRLATGEETDIFGSARFDRGMANQVLDLGSVGCDCVRQSCY